MNIKLSSANSSLDGMQLMHHMGVLTITLLPKLHVLKAEGTECNTL